MRPRIVWTIFQKEITETLRDRRTLVMMVGLPLLLYPLMIIGLSKLGEVQEEAREARASNVAIWGEVSPEMAKEIGTSRHLNLEIWSGISDALRRRFETGRIQLPPAAGSTVQSREGSAGENDSKSGLAESEEENPVLTEARRQVSDRKLDAVLVLWPGARAALDGGGVGRISVYYDSVREDSRKARERLEKVLTNYRRALLRQREQQQGLPEGFSLVLEILPRNVAPANRRSGQLTGSLLPFLLIIVSASACLYAAIDLTAGEKERNTLQTLLCAPVHSREIILGKFLTVWVVALIATLANLVSMAATFARIVLPEGQLSMAPFTYLLAFLMLVPVTFTVTAVFLAVAVFAKDFKDGQNFLTPVLMLLMLPLGITMIPGIELNAWTAFVPVVNIALLIKALFLAEAHVESAFLVLVSSAAYALLALLLAARVFEREQVLLGGQESIGTILGLQRGKRTLPAPSFVLVLFAAIFVLAFYGSLLLQKASHTRMILVTEFVFFLLPTLGIALAKGFDFQETFALRLPPWRGLLAGVLMGLSAWAFVGGLLIRLLPPPESLVRAMEKIFLQGDKPVPLWSVWLVLAISPAFCEELLFRGMMLTGFRRFGMWPAILISGFLFGLAHSSIYRLLPTFFLGAVFGYLAWRTGSVSCSMVAHALNNGIAMSLLHWKPMSHWLGAQGVGYLPWHLTLAGTTVMLVSLWLVASLPNRDSIPSPVNG